MEIDGKKLLELRLKKGYSQRRLSEESGVTLSLIKRIESGNLTNCRIAAVNAFASVYGCGLQEFYMTERLELRPERIGLVNKEMQLLEMAAMGKWDF